MVSRLSLSVLLFLAGSCVGGTGVAAAEFLPIAGELSGKFQPPALPEAPSIDWKAAIKPTAAGGWHLDVELMTRGGRLRASADVDARMANGRWEIIEGELDAAAWLAVLAPKLGSTMDGILVEGKLELRGRGEIKAGEPSGAMSLVWSNGVVRDPVEGWRLDGITLQGELAVDLPDFGTLRSDQPWELSVRTISSPRFGARNLAVTAKLNGDGTASLLSAQIEIAGGKMMIAPSTVALFPPVLDFTVHVDRIGLQDLVALVPASLADARGRVDGAVRLGWSQAAGIQLGAGEFSLRADEAATLRLAPTPGLITDSVTERVAFPSWTGPAGKWLAPRNPVYGDASEIELGRTPLVIESFALQLAPKGDAQGRNAAVRISARPDKPGTLVKRVVFDIDLTGSLSRFLNQSASGRASFKIH